MALAAAAGVDFTAAVSKDIADLVPQFLRNRRAEVAALRKAIEDRSAAHLNYLACRMYGVGNPYGFRQVTTLGRQLRDACAAEDYREARRLVAQYDKYLLGVSITLVDAPPARRQWEPRTIERRAPPSNDPAPPAIERRGGERRRRG